MFACSPSRTAGQDPLSSQRDDTTGINERSRKPQDATTLSRRPQRSLTVPKTTAILVGIAMHLHLDTFAIVALSAIKYDES
ncbi:hypothetical protein EAI_06817 [Harpegnathos saltator]|uniref:Uncharacterized protein n=1 Tax=Harpegnathos saltator TaxID=610380 RepID=E2BB47_HARSA|nr:hypothetical protein EAI_06817 [Harpegnathos saltator]